MSLTIKQQLLIASIGAISLTSLPLFISYKFMWFDGPTIILLTICSVLSSIVTMVFAILFSVPTINKINILNNKTKKIAAGEYHIVGPQINSPKELKSLNDSFDLMAVEIRQQMEQIQMEEREKVMMIENFAHDLKTPLASIKSYSEGLKDGVIYRDGEKDKAYDVLIMQSNRLSQMFDELNQVMSLNVSKVENVTIKIDKLLMVLLDNYTPTMKKENRAFHVHLDNVQPFQQNQIALERILSNFISNAIKFSNDDIWIEVLNDGEQVIIAVKDKGIGISSDHLERIFERTYRVEQSRNKLTGGSGLGLYIAKTLAKQIHCRIEVESNVGSGTAFKLIISKQ
nr:HAMP domain-containing sensor histidine kinase [Macrococcus bohemicus]